jgi:hypothetical protein
MRVLRIASQALRGCVLSWLGLIVFCGSSQLAHASFIGSYSVDHFTVTNVNGPGAFLSPDGGLSVVITGPNNGSGLEGYTDVTTTIAGSGLIQFQYTYSSLDSAGFDYAGYFLGSSFIQLADTDGQTATVLLPVNAGDLFGFRAGSLDNTGEPGIFTVFDFTAPASSSGSGGGGSSTVPEPGSGLLVFTAAASCVGLARIRGKRRRI